MRKLINQTFGAVEVIIPGANIKRIFIIFVGVATFFFGFFAGAIVNLYMIAVNHPLSLTLRTSLTYQSAIFGDGILLPVVNMVAAFFLLKHKNLIGERTLRAALFSGIIITAYFHITQALTGLINWTMPTPWHWNILGVWHALYMFSVASFLSGFYLVLFKVMRKKAKLPWEAFMVTFGIIIFFILLRLDYIAVDLNSLLPSF